MFEVKKVKPVNFSMNQVDQVKANRISEIIDTGETYTATDGTVVNRKRVVKA